MFSSWTARDVIETLSTLTNTSLVTSIRSSLVCFYRFEGLSDSIYTFTEADGSSEEIDESLDTLQTLGFTVNQDMTTGEKDWLGSMIVLTK